MFNYTVKKNLEGILPGGIVLKYHLVEIPTRGTFNNIGNLKEITRDTYELIIANLVDNPKYNLGFRCGKSCRGKE